MSTRLETWAVKSGQETRRSRPPRGGSSPWITLLDQKFDSLALASPINQVQINAAMGATGGNAANTYSAFSIASLGAGRAFRWRSLAGAFGSGTGLTFFFADPFAAHIAANGIILKAAIEYDITFPANMDWSLGGKLPGLGGTATAANPPTGGNPVDTGWSCRGMWVTPGSGTFYGRKAKAPNEWIGYRYCISQKDSFGDNIWSNFSFVAGRTHRIRQEYGMNTVAFGTPVADGTHRMYFDGALGFEDTAVLWRNRSDLGINRHLLHFFRGGSTSNYAGAVDNDIHIDNLKIEVAA